MGSEENNNTDPAAEFIKDKEIKKGLVADTILKYCKNSPHEIFQQIDRLLRLSGDGSKLEATILSGGYTNYSYKVFVDKHPELCFFAKLCFEYALWNPDRSAHYDLKRTENEFEIMTTMSNVMTENIATPLGCWELEHEGQRMKLIATEWSKGDEQFSNQFIDGSVDPRVATKLAETLAALHNIKDFDPDFNVLVKPCMENLIEHMKKVTQDACNEANPKDRTETYCAGLGEEIMMNIINASIADYHKRDCLIHSDTHTFNILVESKPSIEELELFGPNGSMVLCDWEMAFAGPIGRDLGLSLFFPIGCMVAHAFNGQLEATEDIEEYIDTLWEHYTSKMMDLGKTPEEMAAIHRNIIGWCGWGQFLILYVIGAFVDSCPVESEDFTNRTKDSMGILGLKLMRVSYDTDLIPASADSEEIKRAFKSLLQDEVALAHSAFTATTRRMKPRKSSMLRATNRRLSDATMNFLTADSLQRLSISEDFLDC